MRGLGMALLMAGNSLGEMIGPSYGGPVYSAIGYEWTFVAVCFGSVVVVHFSLAGCNPRAQRVGHFRCDFDDAHGKVAALV